MKIAKVITTSFVPRVVREKTGICGDPAGFFVHSQNFTTNESILELIKLNIKLEEQFNPGVDVDLIIINNDSGYRPGAEYLDQLTKRKLMRGTIRVFHRENIGRSFGGYNYAFLRLRDQYDYFIFTEDDIVLWGEGYALTGLEAFNSSQACGFIAYQGVTKKFNEYSLDDSIHVHGGVGITSTKVLDTVVSHYGMLPHATSTESQSYESIIKNGEVDFTNKIHKIGFNICELKHEVKLYGFAYDLMRDIKVPRYASGLNLMNHEANKLIRTNFYALRCKMSSLFNSQNDII
jgi:hypothetical protein